MNKSNNEKEFLNKITNNKLLLFLIPNLICFYQLFYYYNQNIKSVFVVLFYEIIIGCIIFFSINTLIYFILQKILRNNQKVFCIMCIISMCHFMDMNLLALIIFLVFLIFITIDFKYLINFSLDNIVGVISFIVVILFSFTFIKGMYNVGYRVLKSKGYDYEIDFMVDTNNKTPNIYWIHCDGMMNSTMINKYFMKEYDIIDNYFFDNDYYYNPDASLATGHSTARSLTALFNPIYYDDFYKDYLIDLEKTFLGTKDKTDFIVNYYELLEKRLNNELFQALEESNYETVVIGDFNSHVAFYPDHYYDYYHYRGMGDQKREFRYFDNTDNSKFKLDMQLNIIRSGALFSKTIFDEFVNTMNILDYDLVDYNNINMDNYPYTRTTSYWYAKAIFKGIEDSYIKDKNQFVFIDYKLNHYPLTYDSNGEFLTPVKQNDLNYYFDNYVYSSNLLFEMLDYIKSIDEDAVIVVQSDHGINTFKDTYIMKELDINEEELLEIRNSVINAVYVPKEYRNGDEKVLGEPLNISRYLVNNFVGNNYEYIN